MVKRNNLRAKWITFTKQKDGVYTAGKAGRQWRIYYKDGWAKATDYSGDIKACGAKTTTFKAAAAKLTEGIETVASSSSFEKCGQSISKDCEGVTVEMTEEGW